jgi:hypothetical protein
MLRFTKDRTHINGLINQHVEGETDIIIIDATATPVAVVPPTAKEESVFI